MKGESASSVSCPEGCGAVIGPRTPSRMRQHHMTGRQLLRHAVREHLNLRHADLSPRQVSLILDQVCDDFEVRR